MMRDRLQSIQLLLSFKGLQDDGNRRDTQDILELSLKNKVIPLSKCEREVLSFNFEDFVVMSFLSDLVIKGYGKQFILENALRQRVLLSHAEKITTYCFESSTSSLDPLCTFLNDLYDAGFIFSYRL